MNYTERDALGMYKGESDAGPGPELMGADTLIGNDVYNLQDESLGDIWSQVVEFPSMRAFVVNPQRWMC